MNKIPINLINENNMLEINISHKDIYEMLSEYDIENYRIISTSFVNNKFSIFKEFIIDINKKN
jgi:hypothetical protein